MSLLKLDQVQLRLGRSPKPQLDQISFELALGEFAVLQGSTRSGKTLLLKLLNGLMSPSQGNILWQGRPLEAYDPIELRRQIAWLPSQPRLLGMTVAEAIVYPLQLQGLPQAQIQPRLSLWLEALEIPTSELQRRANELNPELHQQVALARSLILEPQLLLLDDPWPQISLENSGDTTVATPFPQALKQALPLLKSHRTALLWARKISNPVSNTNLVSVDRLLLLQQGRLVQNTPATPEHWLNMANKIQLEPSSSTEDWDDWD